MRLYASGLRKIARRPIAYGLFGWLMFQLLAGVAMGATTTEPPDTMAGSTRALVQFPGAYAAILGMFGRFAGLYAVLLGAAIAGSEWAWGTLKVAVTRGESRTRFALVSYASIATILLIGLAVFFASGTLAAFGAATMAGLDASGAADSAALSRVPEKLGLAWLAVTAQGALGFAIATLLRSQLAGIAVVVGLYLSETIFGGLLPDVVKYLPFNAGSAATSTATVSAASSERFGSLALGGGVGLGGLSPDTAAQVVAAWLAAALVVAAIATERAEITG